MPTRKSLPSTSLFQIGHLAYPIRSFGYSGASGNAMGGSAITSQQGLINADLLNFGANGGRGGMSGSGAAQGGSVL